MYISATYPTPHSVLSTVIKEKIHVHRARYVHMYMYMYKYVLCIIHVGIYMYTCIHVHTHLYNEGLSPDPWHEVYGTAVLRTVDETADTVVDPL